MNKVEQVQKILKSVQTFEGEQFQYNEQAILDEYQKKDSNKSSLAIKILSVFGGLFATMTFLGFLASVGLFNSTAAILMGGIAFIILAIVINKTSDKLIYDTFSISIYITGLVLLCIGLLDFDFSKNVIVLVVLTIALSTLILNQTYILSFIAIITLNGCLLTFISINKAYNFIHLYTILMAGLLTYIILNEGKIIASNYKLSKLYNPFRVGLLFSLLSGLIILGNNVLFEINIGFIWLSSIMLFLLVFYLVSEVVKIIEITNKNTQIVIYTLTVLVLSSTIFAPSILGAIIIILLSFLVNYKTGFVIGLIALIYFISQYYYDLNLSLLTKSIILFASGILFLAFYIFIHKKSLQNEKV
jgi:hypothetical protein